jgi:NAD(P)-dependent dehydrogenase (short-subunit alcohol dehydrogenase family)
MCTWQRLPRRWQTGLHAAKPKQPEIVKGETAVVTGAASGMGLKVAERLAAAGAAVVLTDVDAAGLERATAAIEAAGGSVRAEAGDIAEPSTTEAVFALAEREFGAVGILANVAGLSIRRSLGATSLEDWNRTLAINLTGPFLTCQRAARSMEGREGAIVNVSAVAGISGMGYPAYCAAKAGLIGLTRMLATELGPRVRVNAVAPGPTATAFNSNVREDEAVTEMIANTTLLERWADPDEIASTVEFLASSAASYVTGHVLVVDGGMTATINLGGESSRFDRAGE